MRTRQRDDVAGQPGRSGRSGRFWGSFSLFAEAALTGFVVAVASIPVVTAVPALAAGATHLRRHLRGQPDSVGDLVRGLAPALRSLWPVGVLVPLLLFVLRFNVLLAGTGALPGGSVVAVVSWVLLVLVAVVALRTAGAWTATVPWTRQVTDAARRTVDDPAGTALLVAALGMSAVFVWMLPPMLLLVGGLLALAALSVTARAGALPPTD
jgi:hypothetical protein